MNVDERLIDKDVDKVHEFFEEDEDGTTLRVRPEHEIFAERIRKSLYYGKFPKDDRPSLPMTEIAVSYIRDAAPKELGKIDMYLASDIGRRAYVSPCSMMLGMIYIERLKHKNPDYLSQVSSSDLFLISMMVASKYLYDEGTDEEVYNDEWAEAADMETEDINSHEMQFLRAIDWSLFTQAEDFDRLLASMEERTAFTEGYRRKFWTYGDLAILLSNAKLLALMRQVVHEACKVVLVCSIAYTAGVVTMAASMTTLSLLKAHNPIHLATSQASLHNTPELTAQLEEPINETEDDNTAESNDTFPETDRAESEYAFNSLRPAVELNGKRLLFAEDDLLASTRERRNIDETRFLNQQNLGLSLPGFITLAFFKDTVVQILNGFESDEIFDDSVNEKCTVGTTSKCNCHNCPLKYTKQIAKRAVFGHSIPPLSIWSSLKSSYGKRNRQTAMDTECGYGQMSCQNQGANGMNSEESNINDYSKGQNVREENERESRCWAFQCKPRESSPWGFRIMESFAPDLLLGFHTTHFSSRAIIVS